MGSNLHTIHEASSPAPIRYKSKNSLHISSNSQLNNKNHILHTSHQTNTTMAVERRTGLIALKCFMKKLQNHLQLSKRLDALVGFTSEEVEAGEERVPEDVKEGQFAVLAKKDEEKPIRFLVELSVLKHPAFLRLLEMAEEEFGYQPEGALELPCQPEELRRILQDRTG